MTKEQQRKRKQSAENGNIRWIKDNCLRTKDGKDDYVFISYKSDDFEEVLDKIVYNVCKKYGLRVYFDTAFDENSDSWITQYYENMCDPKCKAFVAFIDDAYYTSYACLLEMMSRKTFAAGGDYKEDSLFFLPVNIGCITDLIDSTNTGLGTRRFSTGKINSHAKEELTQFNLIFSEVADDYMRKIYKRDRDKDDKLYDEATEDMCSYGKIYLNVTQCRKLMEQIIPKEQDNDGGNKEIEEIIYDKLKNAGITSVFSERGIVEVKPLVTVPVIQKLTGEYALADFLKEYNPKTFQSSSCKSVKLKGINGCEKYTLDKDENSKNFPSARQMVFAFAMKRLDEMGMEYIHLVNEAYPSKNPIFITEEEHKCRKMRKESVAYTKIISKKLTGYSMCTHYSEYDWLKNSLVKQLRVLGLSLENFKIIFGE